MFQSYFILLYLEHFCHFHFHSSSVCLSVCLLSFLSYQLCVFASFPLPFISDYMPISNLRFTMKNSTLFFIRLGTVDGIHLFRGPERKQDQGRLRVEQLTLQKWDSNQLSLIDEVIIRFRAFTFGDGYSLEVCIPELV